MQPRGKFSFAAGAPLCFSWIVAIAAVFAGPAAMAAPRPADPEPQRVSLQTEDKLTLIGTYFAPRDAKQRAPGVVLVHGAGGSRAELQSLALRLQKSGFAALTLDMRGHGESATEEFNWKKLEGAAQERAWLLMTRDLKSGVDFLLKQKDVHSTTVSLVGRGAGCALVARHAKRDERVRDIVLLSPQTEQLGSTLAKDLIELAGLPVYIGAGKDEATTAKRVAEISNQASAGSAETNVAKVDAAGLLEDNKFSSDLARWMKTKALPGGVKLPEAKPIH